MSSAPPFGYFERPSIWRRFMGMVYEGCLVYFAISFLASYLLLALLQWQWPLNTMQSSVLSAYLFVIYGVYFIYFWTHGGQTLPMKTVEVQLTRNDGRPVPWWQAAWRYVLCWWGLLPGALIVTANPALKLPAFAAFVFASLASMLWAHWDRDGQFLYDRWAGTRLHVVFRG